MVSECDAVGTEAGTGVPASRRSVPTWVEEEGTRAGENEGENAQTDYRENEPQSTRLITSTTHTNTHLAHMSFPQLGLG